MSALLAGQTAFVTGGSRGIGRVVAECLAREGATIGLAARSPEELAEAVAAIVGAGGHAVAFPTDVTDRESAEHAVARTVDELGPIDLLVNNAGTLTAVGPPWEVDPAAWWQDVETSLRGTFLCTRAILPAMVARGSGRVVNVSSSVAVRPSPHQSGYAAAKAGVLSFTEALAAAGREHGVHAFAVAPGFVRTAITDYLTTSDEGRRWLPELAAAGPVEAQRTGELVVFLASGAGDRLSGRFLHALDDVEALVARADEIERDDLYVPRVETGLKP